MKVKQDEEEEKEEFFSPAKGNVVFGSAYEGWGFSIHQFAKICAEKLGMKEKVLMQTLWGEYYFDSKTKKIKKSNKSGELSPMFVQFVLRNIWAVYNKCTKG